MWSGEPHPFPGKSITYQTERFGTTKWRRVIVQSLNCGFSSFHFLLRIVAYQTYILTISYSPSRLISLLFSWFFHLHLISYAVITTVHSSVILFPVIAPWYSLILFSHLRLSQVVPSLEVSPPNTSLNFSTLSTCYMLHPPISSIDHPVTNSAFIMLWFTRPSIYRVCS